MPCPIGTDFKHAASLLRDGQLVAFATETVYGLGGHALDARAVARIFEVKQRPRFDPIIAHVADTNQLPSLVTHIPSSARKLVESCWPGPLTLVLPKTEAVPDILTSGLPSVAVRIPDHTLSLAMLREAGIPVAAPSANLFGRISPTTAQHVADQLGDKIAYILDGGPCRVGVESTVLQFDADEVTGIDPNKPAAASATLLRPGGLPREEIERLIGPVRLLDPTAVESDTEMPSPGMLPKHYAPRTKLNVAPASQRVNIGERVGLLSFTGTENSSRFEAVEVLSPTGDLSEAAANFFAALRRLDALNLDQIVAEPFPDEGLGVALNDRLRRASCD
jgi:L-threonylcarbamoyladenylate synthase